MSCSVSSNVNAFAYLTNHDFTSLLPYIKVQGVIVICISKRYRRRYLHKVSLISLKVSPKGTFSQCRC